MGAPSTLIRPRPAALERGGGLETKGSTAEKRAGHSIGATDVTTEVAAAFSTAGEVLSEAPINTPFWKRPKDAETLALEEAHARELRVQGRMLEMSKRLGTISTKDTARRKSGSKKKRK